MGAECKMTVQEVKDMVAQMQKVFDVVRILDADLLHEIFFKENDEIRARSCQCYDFWKKGHRCENCISAKALAEHGQKIKMEVIGDDVYQVIAKYIEVDGTPAIIEMINKIGEEELLDRSISNTLVEKLTGYKKELYTDALTGVYNRRYYEEHLRKKHTDAGIAMVDVDDFKFYNDNFGHNAGDVALETVVSIIKKTIRKTDCVIRYGGDEFLVIMPDVGEDVFERKLEEIKDNIHRKPVPGYEKLHLSISVGGALTNGKEIRETVARADRCMYRAKRKKNRVVTEEQEWQSFDRAEEPPVLIPSREKILIVDDSEMNRMILSEILQDEFEIVEAKNGEECLDLICKKDSDISLVLLDIVMPIMDGFEVLEYMNEQNILEKIPVIMISSDDSVASIRQAYDYGVADFISRPFDASIVHKRVLNTIKLYAKQRRLVGLITAQIYEKEKNNRMMVSILSQIVEFRNGESGLHVLHINLLTEMLLERLTWKTDKYGLSWSDRQTITTASSLHDIGKIGIDEKILNKPGKLTDEERKIMNTHTTIGASILDTLGMYKDEPIVKFAHQICRWHHERYDGKGYPDGLKGEQIPIAAQVVSLADVYDALVSERCYKKGFSHEKAMEMIRNGECGAFNPLLLECLEEIQDKVKKRLAESDQDGNKANEQHERDEYENTKKYFMEVISQNERRDIEDPQEISGGAQPEMDIENNTDKGEETDDDKRML